jgi:hypothetical protein
MLELMTVPGENVHHIANPRVRPSDCLARSTPCVPLAEWLTRTANLSTYPEITALRGFLRDLSRWSTRLTSLSADITCTFSSTLAACPEIDDEYLDRLSA